MKRMVFYLSDRTGITAETLGHSLLTQFEVVPFERESVRFVDSLEKANNFAARINRVAAETGTRPIVFSTLVNPELREAISTSDCVFFDLFDAFIAPLEQELGAKSSHAAGRSHSMAHEAGYEARVDAVNFALHHDDGISTRDYHKADVIIIGVSRSGKTPTSLYLALHYGIYAANYPLTEEDQGELRLPDALKPYREHLFGLMIKAERLQQIRSKRRPDSRYASLKQCQLETRQVEALYRAQGIPAIDTTTMSVEEIATSILQHERLKRYGH